MNVHLGPSFAGHIAIARDRAAYVRRRLGAGTCQHDWGAVACKNVQHAFSNIQERFLAGTA